ncbi:hypothetical protein [Rhizobium ruizarguesonis]|uniref:hypothetical protein n=1 Tax=Rhizobium ruizarguesonis TaxID=2081791 RepID=UPI00103176A7|nr:hypothetical protein [Rhizobium ruizarguesonis]TBE99662.1 hypothetical protein ELG98_25310 [Rhizobium ruizarguesonis]
MKTGMFDMTNRKNALASSARGGFDYAAYAISPEVSAELEAKAKSLADLGRKETDHVFQLGALLEQVSAHIPDGTFGKWVEARCNITARTARNWRGVYRNLGGYRERAVELAIGPTVLIQLISAQTDKIEAAFAFAEDQGRIQVADVKAILAGGEVPGEDETEFDAVDLGGVHGLKAMVEARTRDSRTALLRNLLGLLRILSGALDEAQRTGKRIKKSRIAPKAEVHAYHAYELLSSLGTGVGPQGDGKSTMKVGLPSASRWKQVEALLWRLRDSTNWAKVDSLETWLETMVIPVLTWATSKEKSPAWPLPEDQSTSRVAVAAPSLDYAEIEDDDVDLNDETEAVEMFEAEALSHVEAETDADVGDSVAALLSGTSGQRRGPGRRKLELVRD